MNLKSLIWNTSEFFSKFEDFTKTSLTFLLIFVNSLKKSTITFKTKSSSICFWKI